LARQNRRLPRPRFPFRCCCCARHQEDRQQQVEVRGAARHGVQPDCRGSPDSLTGCRRQARKSQALRPAGGRAGWLPSPLGSDVSGTSTPRAAGSGSIAFLGPPPEVEHPLFDPSGLLGRHVQKNCGVVKAAPQDIPYRVPLVANRPIEDGIDLSLQNLVR
jgi:hypothetical protein